MTSATKLRSTRLVRAVFAGVALFGYASGCNLSDTEPNDDDGGEAGESSAGRGGAGGASGGKAGSPGGGKAGTSTTGGTSNGGSAGSAAGASGGGQAGANTGGTSTQAGTGGVAGSANASGSGGTAAGAAGTGGDAGSSAGGSGAGGSSGGLGGASGSGGASGGVSGSAGTGGFNPCPATGPCKILPLGDSITDGFNVAGGYRIKLFQKAVEAGQEITFLGGSVNGPQMVAGAAFPRSHEGHSGWTIAQIDGIVPTPALAAAIDAHIVLLLIGTNDMYGSMPATAGERLGPLLDQILETKPEALLVVGTITPLTGNGSANIPPYNTAVKEHVTTRAAAGKHIMLVDQFDDFPSTELADGVHPNQAGYDRMGEKWYAAIAGFLR